jgi:hypothetical protein
VTVRKTSETKTISSGAAGPVDLEMVIDRIDGEYLDTKVSLSGEWWIAGASRHEFAQKLGALIDEYRI